MRQTTTGFTLVEMMVTGTVVVLLAGLLVPVLSQVRERSREATCLTHQRQLAMLIVTYAQDHNDRLPTTDTIWSVVESSTDLLVCPSAPDVPNGYGYNEAVSGMPLGHHSVGNLLLTADARPNLPAQLLTVETDMARRHHGHALVSYLDGHVDSLNASTAAPLTPGTVSDGSANPTPAPNPNPAPVPNPNPAPTPNPNPAPAPNPNPAPAPNPNPAPVPNPNPAPAPNPNPAPAPNPNPAPAPAPNPAPSPVPPLDTVPPTLTVPQNMTVEREQGIGTLVNLVAPQVSDNLDPAPSVTNNAPALFALGTTVVTWEAVDNAGNSARVTQRVVVQDTLAPTIRLVSPSTQQLWPANSQMVPVTVTVEADDTSATPPVSRIISVTSNEPVSGLTNNDVGPDWQITGALTVDLRAQRDNRGRGRIYTLTIETTDDLGNSTTQTVTVTVPRNGGNNMTTIVRRLNTSLTRAFHGLNR
jgi:competence protein ComGC